MTANTLSLSFQDSPHVIAARAASSALVQRRRGAKQSTRELYYLAHSLLRTLHGHLARTWN